MYGEEYMLVQNPEQPNLIMGQQENEFHFRAPRFIVRALKLRAPFSPRATRCISLSLWSF